MPRVHGNIEYDSADSLPMFIGPEPHIRSGEIMFRDRM